MSVDIEDRIRDLSKRHDVYPTFDCLFTFDSDASAKLMALALAGHVVPTRVASAGPEDQVWEFLLDGDLYLVSTADGYSEGFEPRDAQSFDRLAARMGAPDLHYFPEAVAA